MKKIIKVIKIIQMYIRRPFLYGIAVDLNTISNIKVGGRKISPLDIMEIYKKSKTLFYIGTDGNKPEVLTKGFSLRKPIFIDISALTEKEIDELLNKG